MVGTDREPVSILHFLRAHHGVNCKSKFIYAPFKDSTFDTVKHILIPSQPFLQSMRLLDRCDICDYQGSTAVSGSTCPTVEPDSRPAH